MSQKVLVIYTGGTIGMVPRGRGLEPVQDETELTRNVPQLDALQNEVPFQVVSLRDEDGKPVEAVDSSDINVHHWAWMAKQVEKNYDDYDGFVILHGTDTMAYTASALSYMLTHLAKPVVVTGSQIPISRYDTDGVWNFVRSVQIAGYQHTDQPLVPEVCICFNNNLFRGNRVRKMSTSSAQGFGSPNYPVLGDIGEYIRIHRERVAEPADNRQYEFHANTTFNANVLDFAIFPGLRPEALENILSADAIQGMVLRTFGAGNAPNDPALHRILGDAVKAGKVIVNVTPCPEGQVEAGLYAASSALLENGVTSGLDMTPEAALTKLMWLLGTEPDRSEVRSQMQVSLRGELSESLVEARFAPADPPSEDGPVTLSGRPQGPFLKTQLSRAVLRVQGLTVGGRDDVNVGVFINHPHPDKYAEGNRDMAGTLTGAAPQCVVTPTVRRVVEDGRAINITLLAEGTGKIEFDSMALALFTRA